MLESIPTEAITGLASAALGAWTTIQQQKNATAEKMTNLAIARLGAETDAANDAAKRAVGNAGNWVRRALALMAGAYLFIWPALFAFIGMMGWGGYNVFAWIYPGEGGFWLWSKDTVEVLRTGGYIFTPIHTHLASSAFFYYLGGTLGKVKR